MLNLIHFLRSINSKGFSILAMSLILFTFCGCEAASQSSPKRPSKIEFKNYWFQGLAEISRFELEQARYGEIHSGDAVLIFVTEEFFVDKQVKSEKGKTPGAVSVLKLNFVRNFHTGIYPYSMMSSIFTPVDIDRFPQTLKVTTSVQEWCGQTFTQLNLKKNKYHVLLRSYFMDEADREYTLTNTLLEDNLWTLIRIDPHSLKTGDIELVPGSQFSRLKHIPQKKQKATAALTEQKDLYIYSITYRDIPRKLTIRFKKKFPSEIMEWEETTAPLKGIDQTPLTTRAVRTHIMLIDYWNKNAVKDSYYRKGLGLP